MNSRAMMILAFLASYAVAVMIGYGWRQSIAERDEAKLREGYAKIVAYQEGVNAESVSNYHAVAQAYVDFYRDHPVRVRVKVPCEAGVPDRPEGVPVDPESVVFTVGGARRGQRQEAR